MTPEARESAEIPATVEHFQDLEQQAHAAHLGMWIFLASEALLFAGLFALYAAYRFHYPESFAHGVEENPRLLGSLNTLILLISSFTAALAVHEIRKSRVGRSIALLVVTILIGAGFLVIKGIEYAMHFREGVYPGGLGHFAKERVDRGEIVFHTLYYLMTGLHAIHVIVGMAVLGFTVRHIAKGSARPPTDHRVALAAMYWHLVDTIWIFLWPLFYLTGRV